MEQPPQSPEYPRPYGIADMTFEELSVLNTHVAGEFWTAFREDRPCDSYEQSWDTLLNEMRQVIRDNPGQGATLMRQLTHSESQYDKEMASTVIEELCLVDIETGMQLWPVLLVAGGRYPSVVAATSIERIDPHRHRPEDLKYMIDIWAELFVDYLKLSRGSPIPPDRAGGRLSQDLEQAEPGERTPYWRSERRERR